MLDEIQRKAAAVGASARASVDHGRNQRAIRLGAVGLLAVVWDAVALADARLLLLIPLLLWAEWCWALLARRRGGQHPERSAEFEDWF